MKWYNASIDVPPKPDQQVLVSINGIYYVACYDITENIYRLKDQPETYFNPEMHLIYWAEFTSEV